MGKGKKERGLEVTDLQCPKNGNGNYFPILFMINEFFKPNEPFIEKNNFNTPISLVIYAHFEAGG
tara:strand:- start:964 stop:1158 length:195 start_codon:yes stop_codon:yes gene_type:complete